MGWIASPIIKLRTPFLGQQLTLVSVLLRRTSASTQSGEPLDANLGEAIEEFMHYANELKHHVAQGPPPASCRPGPQSAISMLSMLLVT